MQNRFQETFKIVKGNDLILYAERFQAGKDVEPFRWITSYESVRTEAVREAIDSVQLPIDVLIADEAHRMRNSETLQHKVGEVLCKCSESVVFLSATPVQNKLEDLWNLVRLLTDKENGEFALWPLFEQQMEANKWLIKAQVELTKPVPDWDTVLRYLGRFENLWINEQNQTSERDGHLRSLREHIKSATIDRSEIIELQSEIGRLTPVGHIINRTRKSEAMSERPVRDANWKRVTLSETERAIYSGVEKLCRRAWPGMSDSWGFRMSLMMAYRITASCIPAAIDYFAEKLTGVTAQKLSEVIEEFVEDGKEYDDTTVWTGPTRDIFLEYIDLYRQADETDSKFDEFFSFLQRIRHEDEKRNRLHRKVIVFSYFRKTLEYLSKKLRDLKITNRMIHGGVSIDDRERAIDDFLYLQDTNILLTSEVGGEGLDLQRASIVVNYDLPWNPMVVEQRIGRVDRIGQKEKKIIILNLIVKDSIEERVLQRLLKKIDIFRNSIGELDEIIGNEIEEITEQALRGELTDEELNLRIEETGNLLGIRIHEAKRVLSRTDDLLAADQALVDEIRAIIGERQIPAEPELFHFLNTFFAKRFHGCQLPPSSLKKVIDVEFRQMAQSMEIFARNGNSEAFSFARRIAVKNISITLSREAAYSHPAAELIHFDHPLTQFALNDLQKEQFPAACSILLPPSDTHLLPGEYALLLADIKIAVDRPKSKMVAIIVNLKTGEILLDQEETISTVVQMLEFGKDIEPLLLGDNFEPVKEKLISGLDCYEKDWREKEERIGLIRQERQAASRKKALEYRIKQEKDRLDKLISQNAKDFPIRMQKAKYENARNRLESLLSSRPTEKLEIERTELAVGLLQVR